MDEEPRSRRKSLQKAVCKHRVGHSLENACFYGLKKQQRTVNYASRKRIPVSFALLHADLFRHSHHLKRQSSWKTRIRERVALERTIKCCWSRTIQHFRWSRRPFWK